jgi:hypothetical protein
MTPSQATSITPFFTVYGSKAILPTDLEYGAPRVRAYDDQGNQAFLDDTIDQLEEARDLTLLHSAKYPQALRRYHHCHMWGQEFNIENLVLHLRQDNKGRHKLTPPWRAHSSSQKFFDPAPTSLPPRKAKSSPMPRTSNR